MANVAGQRSSTGQIINNLLYNPTLQRQDDQFDVKVNHRISIGTSSSRATASNVRNSFCRPPCPTVMRAARAATAAV